MADIFLSYASGDRERLRPLVAALEAEGFSVWWDRTMHAGTTYDREIETAIQEASCMVVVWSHESIDSEYVRSEVEEGARRNILVPVLIEDVMPPLAHRRRQAADLSDWTIDPDHAPNAEYETLLAGIRTVLSGTGSVEAAEQVRHPSTSSKVRRRVSLATAFSAAAAAAVVFGGLAVWWSPMAPPTSSPSTSRIPLPIADGYNHIGQGCSLSIAPNGRKLVYNAGTFAEDHRVYVRNFENVDPLPLPINEAGSDQNYYNVWFSPDAEWIALVDRDGSLKKVRVVGGTPVTIVEDGVDGRIGWADGQFLFRRGEVLMQVADTGGAPKAITEPRDGESVRDAFPLADGSAILFSVSKGGLSHSRIVVKSLDTGVERELTDGSHPHVTSSGHLLFQRSLALWAVAFDTDTLTIEGSPVRVIESLRRPSWWDVSDEGSLVYIPEDDLTDIGSHLVFVDLDGAETMLGLEPGPYLRFRLSPDSSRLALSHFDAPGRSNIWIHTVGSNKRVKITRGEGFHLVPFWSVDGDRVIYTTYEDGETGLYSRKSDGTGDATLLLMSDAGGALVPDGWASDGLLVSQCRRRDCDISLLKPDGELVALLDTDAREEQARMSPDGRWLAYVSNTSGNREVYVRPYPNINSGRAQISIGFGVNPMWSADGGTLYYTTGDDMMAVELSPGPPSEWSDPVPIFDRSNYSNMTLSPDGTRFLALRMPAYSDRIVLIQNWFEELRRLVPVEQSDG